MACFEPIVLYSAVTVCLIQCPDVSLEPLKQKFTLFDGFETKS